MGCSASVSKNSLENNMDFAASKWAGCLELDTKAEVTKTVAEETAKSEAILFIGYGSTAMFADVEAALKSLEPYLNAVQARCHGQPFLAIYGGDPSDSEAPSIGWFMTCLKRKYRCQILSITAGSSRIVDPDWAFVYHSPEQLEVKDGRECTLYGGTLNGELVGGTRVYLGPDLIEPLPGKEKRLLSAVVVLGGGNVAQQELEYADSKGITWHYLACEAKNTKAYNSTYGPVHDWVTQRKGEEPQRGVLVSEN